MPIVVTERRYTYCGGRGGGSTSERDKRRLVNQRAGPVPIGPDHTRRLRIAWSRVSAAAAAAAAAAPAAAAAKWPIRERTDGYCREISKSLHTMKSVSTSCTGPTSRRAGSRPVRRR